MSQAPPPPVDETVTVVDIVDTLEELVGGARRLPFTPSVVVNEEEILELVDRIRVALPDDLLAARHTLDERDLMLDRAEREVVEVRARAEEEAARLVREAQAHAERLVRDAQAHAAALVDEHAIVRTATDKAHGLVTAAEQQATTQRREADDYARDVMGRLEEQLSRWLTTVREGLQSLPVAAEPAAGRRRRR